MIWALGYLGIGAIIFVAVLAMAWFGSRPPTLKFSILAVMNVFLLMLLLWPLLILVFVAGEIYSCFAPKKAGEQITERGTQ